MRPERPRPASATPLSWRTRLAARARRSFLGLARLSLLLLPTTMVGCVIEDPPPYTQPTQTPPRLDLFTGLPDVGEVIVVPGPGSKIPFNIPVASEDAGDHLVAFLIVDYTNKLDWVFADEVPPGTLDDSVDRAVEMEWTLDDGMTAGCYELTLLVTHSRNQNFESTIPGPFKDDRDVAKAVWRLRVQPPDSETPIECP